jgi:hypothetical protein
MSHQARQVFCKSEKKAKRNNTLMVLSKKMALCACYHISPDYRIPILTTRDLTISQPFRIFLPDIIEEFY